MAALESLGRGFKREALSELQALYITEPKHWNGRSQLVTLALEMMERDVIAEHIEWALSHHGQQGSPDAVVEAYRGARQALPDFSWSEKALLVVQRAAAQLQDNRTLLDAAKQLLLQHPGSKTLPRTLLVSADAQLREGRPGLARATLHNLLARYPLDPLVPHAERKLADVERQLDEMKERNGQQERAQQQLLAREPHVEQLSSEGPLPAVPAPVEEVAPRYEVKPISLHPLSLEEVERLLYGASPAPE